MSTTATQPPSAVPLHRFVGPDFGPACPRLEKKWRTKGCELGQAAKIIAENDDVRSLLDDDDAMPVSVALLGMIYGVNETQARAAVIHWLRRPNGMDEGRRTQDIAITPNSL